VINLDRQFALDANGTNVRTEVIAGVTTFMTMAYISRQWPSRGRRHGFRRG
jgi:xanthine/uracil/vitamin C permease (AzgA family)